MGRPKGKRKKTFFSVVKIKEGEEGENNEGEEFYAGLLKDENTENISDPIINGDDMRSSSLLVLLENDSTEYFRIFSVNMESEISHFTK